VSAFRFCGLVGLVLACVVALGTSARTGISLALEATLIVVAVIVFFVLALLTKALVGAETLIYYHHEIAVLAVTGLVAWALDAPVLAHLDATALGLGAFLCCGRIGCALVGCCHGRPARHGLVYRRRHVAAGFPAYLEGTPLIPVQLLEATAVLALVLAGLTLSAGPPGAAFGLYVSGYAVARFALELARGDPLRRYWHGLSEAQWTSLAVASGIATAAAAGALPDRVAHAAAALLLVAAAPLVARSRRLGRRDVLDPLHVRELDRIVPPPARGRPAVATTTLGIRLSAGVTEATTHYTLSRAPTPLTEADAEQLARLLLWLRRPRDSARIVAGAAGAFHVLVPHTSADAAR
jgi:prolipoprotein diacylglyceryltransferase